MFKVQSIKNVKILNRPAWAKDGVMSASVFRDGVRKLVIGRGFEHDSNSQVDKSFLFKAILEKTDKFKLDISPFIKLSGREVEVSDPTVIHNSNLYNNKTVVLYSVGTPIGQNVTTNIAMSPLNKPSVRKTLINASRLKWFHHPIDKVKEPEILGSHFFYEFGDGTNSRIAVARLNKDGSLSKHKLFLNIRSGFWDSDHVSTGPIIPLGNNRAIMIYNGMRKKVWSIGILIFDTKKLKIINRSNKPFITPTKKMGPHNQRIAFASSAIIEKDKIFLYYHEADESIKVATIKFA